MTGTAEKPKSIFSSGERLGPAICAWGISLLVFEPLGLQDPLDRHTLSVLTGVPRYCTVKDFQTRSE